MWCLSLVWRPSFFTRPSCWRRESSSITPASSHYWNLQGAAGWTAFLGAVLRPRHKYLWTVSPQSSAHSDVAPERLVHCPPVRPSGWCWAGGSQEKPRWGCLPPPPRRPAALLSRSRMMNNWPSSMFAFSSGYIAGFVDPEVGNRSDLFDVYVSLPDSVITVSQSAKGTMSSKEEPYVKSPVICKIPFTDFFFRYIF